MLRVNCAERGGAPESFMMNVIVVVPAARDWGAPESKPPAVRVSPAGKVLPDATLQVYGAMPPLP